MSRITVTYQRAGMEALELSARKLAQKGRLERAMSQALMKAGNKMLTLTRKTLKAQTGVKRYGAIVSRTRGFREGLVYSIVGTGKGMPITEFPVRGRKVDARRFDKSRVWQLQPRDGAGRFGKLKPIGNGVTAKPWAVSHQFKRSYQDTSGVYRALLPGQKRGRGRQLYGPAVWKELVKDASAAVFNAHAPRLMQEEIERELRRLVP